MSETTHTQPIRCDTQLNAHKVATGKCPGKNFLRNAWRQVIKGKFGTMSGWLSGELFGGISGGFSGGIIWHNISGIVSRNIWGIVWGNYLAEYLWKTSRSMYGHHEGYKSLRAAIMICVILVNTQTHNFWPAVLLAQVSHWRRQDVPCRVHPVLALQFWWHC